MPYKASDIVGTRVWIEVGVIEVDENMTLKVEEGACGVRDKDGELIGTHSDEEGIKIYAGSKVYVQKAFLTLVKS